MSAYFSLSAILSPLQMTLLIENMSALGPDARIEQRLKARSAENIAGLATDMIFDLLGVDR